MLDVDVLWACDLMPCFCRVFAVIFAIFTKVCRVFLAFFAVIFYCPYLSVFFFAVLCVREFPAGFREEGYMYPGLQS